MFALKLTKAQTQKAIKQEAADAKFFAEQSRLNSAEEQAQNRRAQLHAERTYDGLTQDSYGGPGVCASDYL